MIEYKDLQTEAKELGIKSHGVSLGKLKKNVDQARSVTPVETPRETPTETLEKKEKEVANVAVVYNATKQEIRRYTEETHGEGFASLAKEFASNREYRVELIKAKQSIVCDNCGHVLN